MLFQNKQKIFYKCHGIEDYEIDKDFDPLAQESLVMRRSRLGQIKQDGDMWFETVFRNCKTGTKRIYFVSHKTGSRCKDEPPSGASLVIYLRPSVRAMRTKVRH